MNIRLDESAHWEIGRAIWPTLGLYDRIAPIVGRMTSTAALRLPAIKHGRPNFFIDAVSRWLVFPPDIRPALIPYIRCHIYCQMPVMQYPLHSHHNHRRKLPQNICPTLYRRPETITHWSSSACKSSTRSSDVSNDAFASSFRRRNNQRLSICLHLKSLNTRKVFC